MIYLKEQLVYLPDAEFGYTSNNGGSSYAMDTIGSTFYSGINGTSS